MVSLVYDMAFKPIEEKKYSQSAETTKARAPELDLKLEKERSPENTEQHNEQKMNAEQAGPQKIKPAFKKRPTMPAPIKDEMVLKIERIMEENLNDSYQRLSPVAKQEFKLKGEQTAAQVRELLKDTHVKVKKVLKLIFDWLRMLPGINHFFLEQEAKIKTDRIVALKKKE